MAGMVGMLLDGGNTLFLGIDDDGEAWLYSDKPQWSPPGMGAYGEFISQCANGRASKIAGDLWLMTGHLFEFAIVEE